jgi:PEP-CTERM motif
MRISARAIFQSILLLSLTAGMAVPEAAAGSIVTFYGGKVTGVLPGHIYPANVATNNVINGSNSFFSYDPTKTPSGNNSNGIYNFTGSGQGLAVIVNTVPSGPYGATWSDSYAPNGSYQIKMVVSGTTTTMEVLVATTGGSGQGKTGAGVELDFTSTTYTGSGTAGRFALPTATNIGAFLSTAGKITWDPGPQGWMGDITEINGQSVPEPSSLVLAGIAMATTGGFLMISRRKAAGRLRAGSIAASSDP